MKRPPRQKAILEGAAELRTFDKGTTFIRIVDLVPGLDDGTLLPRYPTTGFNTLRVANRPNVRGRFTPASNWPDREAYAYYYAASNQVDERVALSEFLERRSIPQRQDGFRMAVRADLFADKGFLAVRLAKAVQLLDVSNVPYADKVFAEWDVLHGNNHRITRNWARYFRRQIPQIDGIFYCPTRIRSIEFGGNIVLFAGCENAETSGFLESETELVPALSREGYGKLNRAGRGLCVTFR